MRQRFLLALMESGSIGEAIDKAGVSAATAYRWLQQDTAFIEEYRAARREALRQATSLLQQKSGRAVEVLAEIMENEQAADSARIQSARFIVEKAYDAYENEELERRMAELEAVLEAGKDNGR